MTYGQADSNTELSPGSCLAAKVGMFGAENLVQVACPGLRPVLPDTFEQP